MVKLSVYISAVLMVGLLARVGGDAVPLTSLSQHVDPAAELPTAALPASWIPEGSLIESATNSAKTPASTGSIEGEVLLGPARTSPAQGGPQTRYRRGGASASANDAPEVRPVLVWVEASGTIPDRGEPETQKLDQVNLQFSPRLVGVRVGGKVRFVNSDPVYHNVFSLSPVRRFDIGRRPTGEHVDLAFDRVGVVQVFCDIHSHMNATIVVMSDRTAASVVSPTDRPFRLDTLPPGEYQLHLFSPGYHQYSRTVRIAAGEVLQLGTIRMEAS